MTDPIALPKLPLDLSNAIVEAPTRLQRTLDAKKGATEDSANDPELLETCRQMESLFIYHLFKEMRATVHQAGFISGGRAEEKGISALFSKRLSRNLMVSTGYQYKITQLFDLTEDADIPVGEEDYNKGTIGIQVVWDTRDHLFYPADGLRLFSGFDISLPALGTAGVWRSHPVGRGRSRLAVRRPCAAVSGVRRPCSRRPPLGLYPAGKGCCAGA